MLALLTAAIVFAALTGDVLLAGAFIAFWLLVGAMRGGIGDD